MKFVLIAIYLAHGSATPEMSYVTGLDKDSCRVRAEKYVKNAYWGNKRAFCVPIKEKFQ